MHDEAYRAIAKAEGAVRLLHEAMRCIDHDDLEEAGEFLDQAGVKVYGSMLAIHQLHLLDDRPWWQRWLGRAS